MFVLHREGRCVRPAEGAGWLKTSQGERDGKQHTPEGARAHTEAHKQGHTEGHVEGRCASWGCAAVGLLLLRSLARLADCLSLCTPARVLLSGDAGCRHLTHTFLQQLQSLLSREETQSAWRHRVNR
jgi:hypothetical protein